MVGNLIAFQTIGVALTPGTLGNEVAFNTFAGPPGAFLPIDLGPNGPTANDPGDPDEGPNRFQNAPEVLAATLSGDDEITVRYRVDTATENAAYPLAVRFYGQGEDDGVQFFIPLGEATYASPGEATATFDNVLDGRPRIVATATDADGNTGEVTLAGVAVSGEANPGVVKEVRVGPNPTAGPLRFAFALAAPADVTVTLFDALGRSVAETRQSGAVGAQEVALDAALPAGVYLWRLRSGARRPRRPPTCGRWGCCCTNCSPASARSPPTPTRRGPSASSARSNARTARARPRPAPSPRPVVRAPSGATSTP